jgi:hypothetical protein
VFTLGLLLTILRIYLERAGKGVYLDFQQFYNLLGLFLGSSISFLLMVFNENHWSYLTHSTERYLRPETPRFSNSLVVVTSPIVYGLFRLGCNSLFAVLPLILAALWGAKATGAYLAGLVVSEIAWLLFVPWLQGKMRGKAFIAAPHLVLVASAMIAAQFTPLVLSFTLTRNNKILLVGVVAVVALIGIVVNSKFSSSPAQGGSDDPSV